MYPRQAKEREVTLDNPKQRHDKCFSPNARSNTLANVSGQCTASSVTIPLSKCFTRSHLAISLLVFSLVRSPRCLNPLATPVASARPAANRPDGELMKLLMIVRVSAIHFFGCGGRQAVTKAPSRKVTCIYLYCDR